MNNNLNNYSSEEIVENDICDEGKFYTVFFDEESNLSAHDCPTYERAEEYAEEKIRQKLAKSYSIQSPC